MSNARLHMSVDQWLEKLELTLYVPLFNDYNGVEDMLNLSERELKTMGVRNGSHRARMATSLARLKDKYYKAQKNLSPSCATLSVKVENPNSRSHGSLSPAQRIQREEVSSGVRSWPCSGQSSLVHSRHSSHRSSMEGNLGMNATADELKKALEYELGLDRLDLRSHAWYHGTILRQRADALITRDGDFIVRDCISQPGDFVITCRWNGAPLHFIIKKVILQENTTYEKIVFCFEDENFDSIQDFVTYYVGSCHPLSATSGAIICNPVNRIMPLTYYSSHYGVQCQIQYAALALEKRTSSPSQSVCYDSDAENVSSNGNSATEMGVLRKMSSHTNAAIPRHRLVRMGSDPAINPHVERKTFDNRPSSGTFTTEGSKEFAFKTSHDKPPPKPSRVPSKKWVSRPLVVRKERRNTPPTPFLNSPKYYVDNNINSGRYEAATPARPIPYKRMMSGQTRFSFLDHASLSSEGSLADIDAFQTPDLECETCFNPSFFQSSLLNLSENKPLEISVLGEVKQLLLTTDSKTLAGHLTRIDLEISKSIEDEDLGLGVTCGLEIMLLPQGRQLVEDLIERTECLKTFVAVTLLTCTTDVERVQILRKWIEVAIDTKNSCGNFYGFTGVMLGLTIPQVSGLHSVWLELRCSQTELAFAFETKLRPAFKSMQDATVQVPPNTCIPYILSVLCILQQQLSIAKTLEEKNSLNEIIDMNDLNFGMSVEENSADFGLQVLEDHLEASRNILSQWPVFLNNNQLCLKNTKYDNKILDLFRTEFHMRMLWGHKGATVHSKERHSKFAKVLDVLFKRYQLSISG